MNLGPPYLAEGEEFAANTASAMNLDPSFSVDPGAGAVGLGEGIRRAQAIEKSRSHGNGYNPGPKFTGVINQETIEESRHDKTPPEEDSVPLLAKDVDEEEVMSWDTNKGNFAIQDSPSNNISHSIDVLREPSLSNS
jgi:hypothetical protein